MHTPEPALPFILRPWKREDLDHLVRFANNRKIADNLTDAFPHPFTRESGIRFLDRFIPEEGSPEPVKAFAIEIEGIACGSIGIFPLTDIRRKNAEMGYWLAEEYWGRGIMTKAVRRIIDYGFQHFDIVRIYARPFSSNISSHRVLEKAGMTLEGIFRKAVIKNGEYLDEWYYSVLKEA